MGNGILKDFHKNLANYFITKPYYLVEIYLEPNARKINELPWQFFQLRQPENLLICITDINLFLYLVENKKHDLFHYWEFLKQSGYIPGNEYQNMITCFNENENAVYSLSLIVGRFLTDIGEYTAAISVLESISIKSPIQLVAKSESNLLTLECLAYLYNILGNHSKAIECYNHILEGYLQQDILNNQKIINTLNQLACCFIDSNRYEEANKAFQQAIKLLTSFEMIECQKRRLMINLTNHYSILLERMKNFNEAESILRKNVNICSQIYGDEGSDTLHSLHLLGTLLGQNNKLLESELLLSRVFKLRVHRLGISHPESLATAVNIASLYCKIENYDKAEPIWIIVIKEWEQRYGNLHPETLLRMKQLSDCWTKMGKYDKAESLLEERLNRQVLAEGVDHPNTVESIYDLAIIMQKKGKFKQAEELFYQCLEIREKTLGLRHPDTIQSLYFLASELMFNGHFLKAIPLLERSYNEWISILGEYHSNTEKAKQSLNFAKIISDLPQDIQSEIIAEMQVSQISQRISNINNPELPNY